MRMQKAPASSALLPPTPRSTDIDLGTPSLCKGHGSIASQKDIKNLAELASSCLIRDGDQRGMRHFGLKDFLFHLSKNRQGRDLGVQCKTKYHKINSG